MTNRVFFAIILSLTPYCEKPAPPSASHEQSHAPTKPSAEFVAIDAKLNREYGRIRKSLTLDQRKELTEEELDWIRFKEGECGDLYPKTESEKDQCLIALTKARIAFINRIYPRISNSQIDGEYLESYGGSIVVRRKGKAHTFDVFVVGSNGHSGQVSGEFEGSRGEFVWSNPKGCHDNSVECCVIRFEITDSDIRLMEEACMGYHGMRAGFNGLFKKARGIPPTTSHNSHTTLCETRGMLALLTGEHFMKRLLVVLFITAATLFAQEESTQTVRLERGIVLSGAGINGIAPGMDRSAVLARLKILDPEGILTCADSRCLGPRFLKNDRAHNMAFTFRADKLIVVRAWFELTLTESEHAQFVEKISRILPRSGAPHIPVWKTKSFQILLSESALTCQSEAPPDTFPSSVNYVRVRLRNL